MSERLAKIEKKVDDLMTHIKIKNLMTHVKLY